MDRYQSVHYLRLGDKHQTVALKEYRSILETDINADVADALFGLASILSVSAMARANETAEAADIPRTMSIESVTEFLILTRGIADIIDVTRPYIQQGPMGKSSLTKTFPLACLGD